MKKGKGKKKKTTNHLNACTSMLASRTSSLLIVFPQQNPFNNSQEQIWEVADVVEFARLQIIYWIKTLRKSDPFQSKRNPIEA